jgi:hypothetical protein
MEPLPVVESTPDACGPTHACASHRPRLAGEESHGFQTVQRHSTDPFRILGQRPDRDRKRDGSFEHDKVNIADPQIACAFLVECNVGCDPGGHCHRRFHQSIGAKRVSLRALPLRHLRSMSSRCVCWTTFLVLNGTRGFFRDLDLRQRRWTEVAWSQRCRYTERWDAPEPVPFHER